MQASPTDPGPLGLAAGLSRALWSARVCLVGVTHSWQPPLLTPLHTVKCSDTVFLLGTVNVFGDKGEEMVFCELRGNLRVQA